MSRFFKTAARRSPRVTVTEGGLDMRLRTLPTSWIALLSFAASAAFGAAPPSAGVDALAWMTGTWSGPSKGLEMEELWTSPRGGSMLGVHRDVKEGRTVSFEFLRIEESPAGITYWASPGGKPATPFRMVSHDGRRVVFENPKHDFPTRVLYWLGADGSLHARIEGSDGGKPVSEEWSWQRAR
jgi:hypothetical protein